MMFIAHDMRNLYDIIRDHRNDCIYRSLIYSCIPIDWRSLTQVKELGILVRNCPLLAADLDKVE